MSYYTLYNMSSKSRKGSQLAVETIGQAAEAFLFAYLGLSLFGIAENHISIEFSFFVLFATFISRAFAIIISYLLVCKLTEKLDKNQLLIIWFSGLVKGAIAFGLSAQIPGSLSPKRSCLISTTISIVLLSTIIIGGLMSFFAGMVGLSKENEMLKRMYASIGRDAGKKDIALSLEEPGLDVEPENDSKSYVILVLNFQRFLKRLIMILASTIKGKLMAVKHMIRDKLLKFDSEIMRKFFGGATHDDEEQEKEEEEIEEELALKIFAEQHQNKFKENTKGKYLIFLSKIYTIKFNSIQTDSKEEILDSGKITSL